MTDFSEHFSQAGLHCQCLQPKHDHADCIHEGKDVTLHAACGWCWFGQQLQSSTSAG